MQLISDTLIQKGVYLTVEIYFFQRKDYHEGLYLHLWVLLLQESQ